MARTLDPARHAARRRHIQDSAAALFAEHGYDRTTTAQICRAAGISPGNLYHYFASKKQVFVAVLTDDDAETADLLEHLLRSDRPLEALTEFVDHLAAPAAAHPAVPKLVLEALLQAHRDPEIAVVLEEADAAERDGMAALVRRAVDAGEARADLDPADTAAWLSTLVGAVYLDGALQEDGDTSVRLGQLRHTVRAYLTA
ncbi:TetR/AcrR family transcriptional regulator [Georgenia alba]|uniref:TetR/AcrR family transcriptional regulator n=1 Tax=Georgenia alba TaxID=2233858 RepID=A0ABW2Q9S1_9MICO